MNATDPFLSQNATNANCNPISRPKSVTDQFWMTFGFAVLLFLALVGNSFVILVFGKRSNELRCPVGCFIVNMAVSDLLVPIFVIPRRIQEIYLGFVTPLTFQYHRPERYHFRHFLLIHFPFHKT